VYSVLYRPKFAEVTRRAQKVYQDWLRKTEESHSMFSLATEKCVDNVTVCKRGKYIID
jgi:DNA transposition AAA+ family ATPase